MFQHQINLYHYFDHSGHNHNHQVSKAIIYCNNQRNKKKKKKKKKKKSKRYLIKKKRDFYVSKSTLFGSVIIGKKIYKIFFFSLPVDFQFLYKFHQDFQDHQIQDCKSHKHPLYHLMDHMGSNYLLLHNFDMFHQEDQMSSCNQKHLFIEQPKK